MSEITKERMDEIRESLNDWQIHHKDELSGDDQENACCYIEELLAAHDALAARCRESEARERRLREFAIDILEDFPDSSPDEFEIQDLAVKHGILVGHEVTEPCGENCGCAEYNGNDDFPLTCYRRAEWLTLADTAAPGGADVAG